MKIGLVAISGKPVTAGHWSLITLASRDNDSVKLFVSLADRMRKQQFPIYGEDMANIWSRYLENKLPGNVDITYGGSPVRNIWTYLEEAQGNDSADVFSIYGDPADLNANFSREKLSRYVKELWVGDQIVLRPMERSDGVDISGTRMREFLSSGLDKTFMQYLPPPLSNTERREIWDILSRNGKNEALLRRYLSEYLQLA